MKYKKEIIVGVLLLLAGVIFAEPAKKLGGIVYPNALTTASTTVITITANTPQRLLATSTTRQYAIIQSNCASAVYLGFADVSPVTGEGIYIASSSSYVLNQENLYQGTVKATTSPGVNCVVTVTEMK